MARKSTEINHTHTKNPCKDLPNTYIHTNQISKNTHTQLEFILRKLFQTRRQIHYFSQCLPTRGVFFSFFFLLCWVRKKKYTKCISLFFCHVFTFVCFLFLLLLCLFSLLSPFLNSCPRYHAVCMFHENDKSSSK